MGIPKEFNWRRRALLNTGKRSCSEGSDKSGNPVGVLRSIRSPAPAISGYTQLAGELVLKSVRNQKPFLPDALILAHLALASAESLAFPAALIVGFLAAAFLAGADEGLLPPLFFAAQRAFIKSESLALAAADIGLRPEGALLAAAGVLALI